MTKDINKRLEELNIDIEKIENKYNRTIANFINLIKLLFDELSLL